MKRWTCATVAFLLGATASLRADGSAALVRHAPTLNGNVGTVPVPAGTYGSFVANAGGFVLGVAGATESAVYNFQSLTFNGSSVLTVVGPVVVTVANGFSANGTMGAAAHPEWLSLRLSGGGLTLNGAVSFYGQVTAPSGAVTVNGGCQLVGGVTCDRLTVNSGGQLRLLASNQPPAVSLTAPAEGAVFTAPSDIALSALATDSDGSIAKVEFFNGTTLLGECTVYPYQLTLTAVAQGSYAFSARATDNAGASTDSTAVSVTVTSPNLPPTVELTAPADGTVYNAPATLALAASASDSDGTVARVEFYRDTTKLGEATAAPYGCTWTGIQPGSYAITAKAIDDDGAVTVSSTHTVTVQVGLPYFTGFEETDGFALGAFAGQGGWTASDGVTVTDSLGRAGTRSVTLAANPTPAQTALSFPAYSGQTVVFVECYVKPSAGTDAATAVLVQTEIAKVAFTRSGTQGVLLAFNGDGSTGGAWQACDSLVALDTNDQATAWLRLTLREDFSAKRWDLYADGKLVACDLGFTDNTAGLFSQFALTGHRTSATSLDDFYAGFDNPVFTDADKDGMDDAWETTNGLDPTGNDRAGDKDGDGLTNIREFMLGLRADKTSTYDDGIFDADRLRLNLSLTGATTDDSPPTAPTDLAGTATSTSITLTWTASTDNLGVAGYLVYRNGQPIETATAIRGTSYTDGSLPDGQSFGYRVRAFDYAGNLSPLSDAIQISTLPEDSDGNGMPDVWQMKYFSQLGVDPAADADGDGVSNLQEYLNGTDPKNFYNGVSPTQEVLYGDRPGPDDRLAMIVRKPDGTPWPNAPVDFDITSGRRRITATLGGADYSHHVRVRADADGIAQCYLEPLK